MTQMLEISTDAAQPVGLIRTEVGTLRRTVSRVAQVVERRNTIPVLSCLLMETDGSNNMRITGTDLDTVLTMDVALSAPAAAARITVPAALLSRVLRGAEKGDLVEISTDERPKYGTRSIRIAVGPLVIKAHEISLAEDFPLWSSAPLPEQISVPSETLRTLIDSCSLCISDEETRYYLNGIYLHGVEGVLCGVATNGHQLARYSTEQPWPLPSAIIHKKSVKILRQMLAGGGDVTVLGHESPALTIRGDGWTLAAKTIDGTFPDYTRVIPTHATPGGTACLNAALFRRLPRWSERGRAAALDLKAKTISVTAPGEYDAEMPIEATGEIRIGFNVNYLADMTAAWGTIRLTCGGTGDAALIHSEDPNLLGVIMPMRVS